MITKQDKFDALVKDITQWADEDIDTLGRDILKRNAEEFAGRLKALVEIVKRMRTNQKTYFRVRTQSALHEAKDSEFEVDTILKNDDRPPDDLFSQGVLL